MTRRVTNIGSQVEYIDTSNFRRITNIGVQVEYNDEPPPPVPPDTAIPKIAYAGRKAKLFAEL